jgi:amino acid transporter
LNLYEIFDWTWHLSNVGDILWRIFISLVALWYMLGLFVVLLLGAETWKEVVIYTSTYVLIPPILILIVGYIGYSIL